jgi:PhoH-like ATPase
LHEAKTILTRIGEGSKVILTGDIMQIDNPYIDAVDNGLSCIVEKFKNSHLSAHITLVKGERSELATLAAEIL